MNTEQSDTEPQIKVHRINTASATIIAAVIGLVGVVVTVIFTYKVHTTDMVPPPPGAQPSAIPNTTTTTSLTPTGVPSNINVESPPGLPQGKLLGTPFLVDLDNTLVARDGIPNVSDTTVTINGRKADHAINVSCGGYCDTNTEAYVTLNLGRKYSIVKAHLGATDKSPSAEPVTIEVIMIDGDRQTSIYKRSFRVGESGDVALPVSNVLQLKFVFRGSFGHAYAGVGDPTAF